MKKQIPLSFPVAESYATEDFMPADCNQAALDWIARFPQWPSPLVIFCGDHGAGKTHLLHLWANKSGAKVVSIGFSQNRAAVDVGDLSNLMPTNFDSGLCSAGLECTNNGQMNLAIDDAHLGFGDPDFEQNLFHLYNQAKENLTYIIMAMSNNIECGAFKDGQGWGQSDGLMGALEKIQLPDLKSRLKAAPMVVIDQPDDTALQAVLVKLFHDRQLKVEPGVINYILPRIERSFNAARVLVARIDENSLAEKRSVTVPLVRGLLA